MNYLTELVVTAFAVSLILPLVPARAVDDRIPAETGTEHRDLKTVSYLVGADIGASVRVRLKHSEINLDLDRFVKGLKQSFQGQDLKISEADRGRILGAFSSDELLPRPVVEEIVSYLMGGEIGENMKHSEIDFDLAAFVEGLSLAVRGEKLRYSREDHRRILNAFALERRLSERRQTLMTALEIKTLDEWEALAAENRKAGMCFLAANASQPGVRTTASGLQYQIITRGEGAIPQGTDFVKAAYRVTFAGGPGFADSDALQSHQWRVGDQVAGLSEAVQMMPVGSKWKLFIPSDLGYADMGRLNPAIGPDATLILEIELEEIARPVSPAVQPASRLTPPIAVTFPKQKGDAVEMTRVDPKTGEPVGDSGEAKPGAGKKSDSK